MAARSSLIDLPPLDLRERLAGGAARAAEVADADAARVESDPAAAAKLEQLGFVAGSGGGYRLSAQGRF